MSNRRSTQVAHRAELDTWDRTIHVGRGAKETARGQHGGGASAGHAPVGKIVLTAWLVARMRSGVLMLRSPYGGWKAR